MVWFVVERDVLSLSDDDIFALDLNDDVRNCLRRRTRLQELHNLSSSERNQMKITVLTGGEGEMESKARNDLTMFDN